MTFSSPSTHHPPRPAQLSIFLLNLWAELQGEYAYFWGKVLVEEASAWLFTPVPRKQALTRHTCQCDQSSAHPGSSRPSWWGRGSGRQAGAGMSFSESHAPTLQHCLLPTLPLEVLSGRGGPVALLASLWLCLLPSPHQLSPLHLGNLGCRFPAPWLGGSS